MGMENIVVTANGEVVNCISIDQTIKNDVIPVSSLGSDSMLVSYATASSAEHEIRFELMSPPAWMLNAVEFTLEIDHLDTLEKNTYEVMLLRCNFWHEFSGTLTATFETIVKNDSISATVPKRKEKTETGRSNKSPSDLIIDDGEPEWDY